MSAQPILLAAGGTGGHMFPAEATARALLAKGRDVVLVTDARGQAFDALPDVPVHRIAAASPSGGLLAKAKAAVLLARGTGQASRLIGRLDPAAVIGFGSYASIPTLYAGAGAGVPLLLHEQNAHLGRANRLMANKAAAIGTGFPRVDGLKAHIKAPVIMTGNPVRPAFLDHRDTVYAPPAADRPIRLLVLGGSQGARALSDLVPAALTGLPTEVQARIRLTQQVRTEDLDRVRAAYADTPIEADLARFFTDVPDRLAAAHLVIARAGASTVAELTCLGRPAILIPYPFATDDHQALNAQALEAAGAAMLAPQHSLTAERLREMVNHLLMDVGRLGWMAGNARAFAPIDAADRLADLAIGLGRGADAIETGRPA